MSAEKENGSEDRTWLMYLPLAFLIIGALLLAVSIATGGAKLGLLIIIPFIVGTDIYSALGILCIVLGLFSWFLLPFMEPDLRFAGGANGSQEPVPSGTPASHHELKKKTGGVIFIGPIPIIFGSDPRTALRVAVAGFLIFVVLLVLMIVLG